MTDDLHLTVDVEPDPGLLRPAIEAALVGRPWPPGPEALVAAAVAAAVRGSAAAASGTPDGAGTPAPRAPGIRPPQPTSDEGGGR
jgi:hypothetical protein